MLVYTKVTATFVTPVLLFALLLDQILKLESRSMFVHQFTDFVDLNTVVPFVYLLDFAVGSGSESAFDFLCLTLSLYQ